VVTNHCWWIWKGYRRFWNFESVINIYWSYVEKRAFPLFFSYVEVNFQNINIFGVTLAILLQMCIYMILRYNFNSCSADNNALRGNVWSNLLPFCWMNSYRCGSRIQVWHSHLLYIEDTKGTPWFRIIRGCGIRDYWWNFGGWGALFGKLVAGGPCLHAQEGSAVQGEDTVTRPQGSLRLSRSSLNI